MLPGVSSQLSVSSPEISGLNRPWSPGMDSYVHGSVSARSP